MSLVLIIDHGVYKCSCGGDLTKKNTGRGSCPACGERLTEVMLEAEYLAGAGEANKAAVKSGVKAKAKSGNLPAGLPEAGHSNIIKTGRGKGPSPCLLVERRS